MHATPILLGVSAAVLAGATLVAQTPPAPGPIPSSDVEQLLAQYHVHGISVAVI